MSTTVEPRPTLRELARLSNATRAPRLRAMRVLLDCDPERALDWYAKLRLDGRLAKIVRALQEGPSE